MLFENKRKGEETMMKQMTRNKAEGTKNKKKSMQWAAAVMALIAPIDDEEEEEN